MLLSTPFGQRQFSPPADVPEYEGANQNDMDIYSGDTNTKRIAAYKKLADAYLIQEGIVRDIFNAGAEWALQQSAPKIQTVPILCPKCQGEGRVPSIGTSSSTTRLCPVCNGLLTLQSTITF